MPVRGGFPKHSRRFEAGLALSQEMVAAYPTETVFTSQLGYCYAYRGWARVRLGQSKDAAIDCERQSSYSLRTRLSTGYAFRAGAGIASAVGRTRSE